MRLTAVCLLVLVVACCGPSPASAKQSKARPSACKLLKQRYKDVAPSRKLVTVVSARNRTHRIRACVLPRGKVRTLARWTDDDNRRAWVVDTAGTRVLVEQRYSNQYARFDRSLTRVAVRGGRRLVLSSFHADGGFPPLPYYGTDFGQAGIAPSGAGAYELVDYAGHTGFPNGPTTLQAFNPAGTFTKLADGRVQALRVTRTQVTWTQAGVAHAAPLPH